MKKIDNESIDMILTDLPYGLIPCKWDKTLSLDLLWIEYKRIIKERGCIALTAVQPFTSKLIISNLKMFRYNWIWKKTAAVGHLNSYKMPMRNYEEICIFYKKLPIYNPQLEDKKKENIRPATTFRKISQCYKSHNKKSNRKLPIDKKLPSQILEFNNCQKFLHPTQKPLKLFEYLIKTYTNENDLVLDSCAGSFTTAVACENLNRKWICIEKEREFCEIGLKRIKENRLKLKNKFI